tara:strand:- start:59 stop:1024 length:966 start_codon:yes stop_codon:yes gene_type:complete
MQALPTPLDYELELAFASRLVLEAGEHLLERSASEDHDATPQQAIVDAQQILDFELAQEPAVSLSGTWVSHVDEHIVSVALVHREQGPVVGAVSRPATRETIGGAVNTGAFRTVGDEHPVPLNNLGMASTTANIVHVPHDKCPEIELALDALYEKMPVDVTRVPCCCCCEGLFELAMGRADVHVSPPEHCFLGQQRTPVPVLCAFEVLLSESGGQMSDVLGNELNWSECLRTGEHRGGILASEVSSHNFMLKQVRRPFKEAQLTLPRLSEAMRSFAHGFRIESAGGGRHRVVQDALDGWRLSPLGPHEVEASDTSDDDALF